MTLGKLSEEDLFLIEMGLLRQRTAVKESMARAKKDKRLSSNTRSFRIRDCENSLKRIRSMLERITEVLIAGGGI